MPEGRPSSFSVAGQNRLPGFGAEPAMAGSVGVSVASSQVSLANR